MDNPTQLKTQAYNMGVKWPNPAITNGKHIALASMYQFNNATEPAIGEYVDAPPPSGTYVLGAINGVIQWIETEDCA